MEDSRIFHLRRIGPSKTLPIAVDHMDFTNSVSIIGRGRTAGVDFIIDSANRNRSLYISRIHARVVKQDNKHILYDDSRNGVFVNNLKIGDSIHLNEGDRVTFGHHIGENLAIGTRRRQPDSEYQFIFERCNCGLQNQGRQTAIGSRTMTIIDSINSNACMPRGYNTEVPMTTSVQRQTGNSSKNEIAGIICNRPCHTEMSVEGMHVNDPISNDNISRNNDQIEHADLPTIAVSSNLTEAMDDNANFPTNSVTNSSYVVTEAGSVRDEEEIGTSSLKNNNSLKTETSFINVQGLETVSLNGNISDMPCMEERIVTNEMPSGDENQNLIDNNKEDNTRELNISMESIQESYERQSVESVENLNEEIDGEDDSLGKDGDSANSGEEHQGDSANSGKEYQGHSSNSDEENQGHSANSDEEDQGHAAYSGEEDQGHSAYSDEEDQGHSDNSGEEDQGHSDYSGEENQDHSAYSGEENEGHSDNSGDKHQGHSANSGEEHQGENGIDQNIEEFVEENRQLTRNSRSTADNEDNEYNDLNVSEMFDESFSEEEDEVDLNILENDDNDGEDGDDQLEDGNNRRDNSDSNQKNKVVHEKENGESSIFYSSSIDYSLVDICEENNSSQNDDKVENADEIVRSDENSDQDKNKSEDENDYDVVIVGENSDDDVREVKSIDDVDENNVRDTDSVESCSIEYNDLDGSGAVDSHSDNYNEPSFIDLDVSELESGDEDHEESGDEEHEESDEEDEITVLKMKIRKEEESKVCPVKESPEGISFSEESADEIEEVGDHVICDEKNDKQFEEKVEDNENIEDGRNMENITDNKNSEIQEDEKNQNSSEDHENQEGSIEDKFQVYNQESNAKNESPYSFANDEKQENIEDNGKRENFQDDDDHDESVEEEYDDSLECSVDDINEESVESYENEDNVVEDLLTVTEKPNRKDDGSLRSIEDDQEIVDNYGVKQNVSVFIETPNIKEQETKEALWEHTEIFIKEEGESKTNCKYDENQESEKIDGIQDGVEDHEKQEREEMDGTRETFEDHEMQENEEMDRTQGTLEDEKQKSEDHENQESEESIEDHENQESEEIVDHENQEINRTQERVKNHEKQESEEIKTHEKQESEEIDGTQESIEKHEKPESEEIGDQEKQESEEIDGKHESIEDHEKKKRKQIDGTEESIEENGKQEIEEIEDHENKSEEIDGTQESVTDDEKQENAKYKVNQASGEVNEIPVLDIEIRKLKEGIKIAVGESSDIVLLEDANSNEKMGDMDSQFVFEDQNLEGVEGEEKGNTNCKFVESDAIMHENVDNLFNEVYKKEYQMAEQVKDQHIETLKISDCHDKEDHVSVTSTHMASIDRDEVIVHDLIEKSIEKNLEGKFDFDNGTEKEESLKVQLHLDIEKTKLSSGFKTPFSECPEDKSVELIIEKDQELKFDKKLEKKEKPTIAIESYDRDTKLEMEQRFRIGKSDMAVSCLQYQETKIHQRIDVGNPVTTYSSTGEILTLVLDEKPNLELKQNSEKGNVDKIMDTCIIVNQSAEIEMTEGQTNEMVATTEDSLEVQNNVEQSSGKR
ncbi:unnamed protein product [Mytilus coruscus]|uniref:FHA domain-containing protein n=1 Tax=Mytilus coruscus TaxID=42192 RepID=A0A6J7ZXU1_MYTCO|nr:unnamed protein product [Mytilus coruscus]